MERRLIFALILSILILVVWNILFPPPKKPLEKAPVSPPQKETAFEPQPISPQNVISKESGREIEIGLPLYTAVFSTKGGVLTGFELKKYPEEHIRIQDIERAISSSRDKDLKDKLGFLKEKTAGSQGVEMVSTSSYLKGIFPLSLNWEQESLELNYSDYQADKTNKTIVFSFAAGGLTVIKKYILREDACMVDIEIKFINEGKKTFSASPLIVRYGPGLGLTTDPFRRGDPYYRCLALIKERGMEKIVRESFGRGKRGSVLAKSFPDAIWGGIENKYFMAAFIPPPEPHSIFFEKDASGDLNAGLKMQLPELMPGGMLARRFSMYLGPKDEKALNAIGGGLEKSVDYGMLASALKIMAILRFFHRISGNWGLAIIMLTILTKIVLLPLTQKSFRSMERMQGLQPKLKELRLKYKDDPRKQQKELMELYRREGVNPMGGCLPMLVQMPVFIALFTTLRNTIDLRGAKFLWIKDLSMPDTVSYLSGIPINPLVLIMGLSMFWQQKMTTTDPEQAKMMVFMPVVFTAMFYNFSSGLVLYWFVQNILTLAHQYSMRILHKKNGKT